MTFLSLRNERGFDDVNALLRPGDEIRPGQRRSAFPARSALASSDPLAPACPTSGSSTT
jgi:hypothetical protein